MESFTVLCKVCCRVKLNNRISLKIAVLAEYAATQVSLNSSKAWLRYKKNKFTK